ncbi:MAG: DUF4080 domain-containing protein [Myxococcaceae bacterium]
MSEVVLATLNARYAHASLALRYLQANLGRPATLREYTLKQSTEDIAQDLLSLHPRILGLGVYIWNVKQTTALVRRLKSLRPELMVILGGPEVSHEVSGQEIVQLADYVITGEGEIALARLCQSLVRDECPKSKIIPGELPDMATLTLPYALYDETDIRQRVIYVEASRGCPFRCEFCLSSLDQSVRDVPLDRFLPELQRLLDRGVTQLKFIDRTFNLKVETGRAILQFFLERYRPGMFLHFEMIPDRLPAPLREVIAQFPAGALQFEVGVQTFDDAVSKRISRHQNLPRLEDNFRFLRDQTGVHVHADLIVGLPGETLETFAAGFDRLLALRPQEIQVGMLKRLKGTPIIRHDAQWGMRYDPEPPFEIRETSVLSREEVQRMRRFAKYWDAVHNSGNFRQTVSLLLPFQPFLRFTDWLHARVERTHSIPLDHLTECVFEFLLEQGHAPGELGPRLLEDYLRPGGRRVPPFLNVFHKAKPRKVDRALPARQARHLA